MIEDIAKIVLLVGSGGLITIAILVGVIYFSLEDD
jgi:hypothetical protein